MRLIARSYDTIELQRLRTELESRGMPVHVSDEFTYAIPGMPGAEQPRGLWVGDDDWVPARRVVADLIGARRLEPEAQPEQAWPADSSSEYHHPVGRLSSPSEPTRPSPAWATQPRRLGLILSLIALFALSMFALE